MSAVHRHATVGSPTAIVMLGLALSLVFGCGDEGTRPAGPFGNGGSVGSGGTAASNGAGGFSGMGGTGAVTGTGGVVGTGGTLGTGGTTGTAGTGGSPGGCVTNALCETCPATTCNDDSDCSPPEFLPGLVCVPTGCTSEGEPLKECQPARYISCETDACPSSDYECKSILGKLRCVRKEAGCTEALEDFDCPLGFSCEEGACVDRRFPCDRDGYCPKNHVCVKTLQNFTTSPFCVSPFRTCRTPDLDCTGLGSQCADVDGDVYGLKECIGDLDGAACVNQGCENNSAPVCEVGNDETVAVCGQYGLCLDDGDCASGFVCVGLWQDGRKECVPVGGTCDAVTDCLPNQVCAAPRNGGYPRCQAGKEAL